MRIITTQIETLEAMMIMNSEKSRKYILNATL